MTRNELRDAIINGKGLMSHDMRLTPDGNLYEIVGVGDRISRTKAMSLIMPQREQFHVVEYEPELAP